MPDQLERKIVSDLPYRSNPPFHDGIASEPTVQVLFRDLVRPGDYVYDIGAHIGTLTQALSRLVGPFGCVLSVEANPITMPSLTANVVKNALNNVFLLNEAIWNIAGLYINVIESGAASGVSSEQEGFAVVTTTTIDELGSRYGKLPTFIKIDIEGAEYQALLGARNTLAAQRPSIIFEHNTGDDRALHLLRDLGYWTMEVSSYSEVKSSDDLPENIDVSNILAVKGAFSEPYRRARVRHIKDIDTWEKFFSSGVFANKATIEFTPGRYIIDVQAHHRPSTRIYSRVSRGTRVVAELCTEAAFFLRNHRRTAFHVDRTGLYTFELGEYLENGDPAIAPTVVSIFEVVLDF